MARGTMPQEQPEQTIPQQTIPQQATSQQTTPQQQGPSTAPGSVPSPETTMYNYIKVNGISENVIIYVIINSRPSSAKRHVYLNTEGVYDADELGPIKVESEYDGNDAPITMPAVPSDVTDVYANRGPVVKSKTIASLDLKSSYNKKPPSN